MPVFSHGTIRSMSPTVRLPAWIASHLTSRHADATVRRRATLLNHCLAVLAMLLLASVLLSLVMEGAAWRITANRWLGVGLLVSFGAAYALNRRGLPRAAAYVFLVALVLALALSGAARPVEAGFFWYALPLAAAGFILAPGEVFYIAALCLLASGAVNLLKGEGLQALGLPALALVLLGMFFWWVSWQVERSLAALQQQFRDLSYAYDRALLSWARMIEQAAREPEGHTERVTELAVAIGRQMNLDERQLDDLRRGGWLHDIGKMNIPVQILRKSGTLDEKEAAAVQRHPVYAYEMLGDIPFLRGAVDVALYHHEFWNGNGYPSGLKGEAIPLLARIFAVADNWDALSTDRSYRLGWPKAQVKAYLQSEAGRRFDPTVVEALCRLEIWQGR